MPTMTRPDGRRIAGALADWVDAVLEGDGAREARRRGEAARLARALAGNPVLGPALARHLPGGVPTTEVAAVACILAVLAADDAARAAAPHN